MATRRVPTRTNRRRDVNKRIQPNASEIAFYELVLDHSLNIKSTKGGKRPLRAKDGNAKLMKAIAQYGTRLSRQPKSSVTVKAEEFGSMLDFLNLQLSWTYYVPSRLGHNSKVDLAAHAVTIAYRYKVGGEALLTEAVFRHYSMALATLRDSIDTSDASLMAVALLALFESVMEFYSDYHRSHQEGIGKILLARRHEGKIPTEFERAMLYTDWNKRNQAPIARGTASPFEYRYWLDMDPPGWIGLPPVLIHFQKVTNQLSIRFPRLVMWTRAVRGYSDNEEGVTAQMTVELANNLLKLEAEAGESEILHRVKICETENTTDQSIVAYSFEFSTFKEVEIALHYWRTRLWLLRLCFVLLQLPETREVASSTFDQSQIQAKIERAVTNSLMSRQFASRHTKYGPIRVIESTFSCWAALSCLQSWRGIEIPVVRQWLVMRFNEMWSPMGSQVSAKSMDEICEVSIGGPLRGFFVKKHAHAPKLEDSSFTEHR